MKIIGICENVPTAILASYFCDCLEGRGLSLYAALCRKALDGGSAEEAVDLGDLMDDVRSVARLCNGAAVADDHNVGAHGAAGGDNGLYLSTQSSRVSAVLAPMVPLVVRPMWATRMSAPASAMAFACSGSNT